MPYEIFLELSILNLYNTSKLIEDPEIFLMSSVSITLSLDIIGLPINLSSL